MSSRDLSEVAHDVVREALDETPTAVRRIPEGRSNHVLKVDVGGGRSLAVRLSKVGTDRFEIERAVMRAVADVGVRVPRVRYIGPVAGGERGTLAMITEWIDAPALAGVSTRSAVARRALADELADTLVRIHSCPVRGFGNLDAGLRGVADRFLDWFAAGASERIERSIEVLARYGGDAGGLPAEAAEVLAERADVFGDVPERLVHGDVSPANLLVRGTSVAAVLDWEGAKGGPPSLDLGWLAYIDAESHVDQQRLMVRYAAITGCDIDALVLQSRLVELRILASAAEWQARAHLTAEIPRTLRRLADALAWFRAT